MNVDACFENQRAQRYRSSAKLIESPSFGDKNCNLSDVLKRLKPWILGKSMQNKIPILFYPIFCPDDILTTFPLYFCEIHVKLTPLFFIKASNVETSWLKRCSLIMMEADVQTFQQKPNFPHHLHSGASLQAFSSFPGHFLAQLDLVLALQSPCTFCSELAEASTCSEWS